MQIRLNGNAGRESDPRRRHSRDRRPLDRHRRGICAVLRCPGGMDWGGFGLGARHLRSPGDAYSPLSGGRHIVLPLQVHALDLLGAQPFHQRERRLHADAVQNIPDRLDPDSRLRLDVPQEPDVGDDPPLRIDNGRRRGVLPRAGLPLWCGASERIG